MLVISMVQLRLVVRVAEWASAFSGMVAAAGNVYKKNRCEPCKVQQSSVMKCFSCPAEMEYDLKMKANTKHYI